MKVSDLFVDILIKKWVTKIYWVPWEENLDLIESIRESWKIDLILTRNEQTGAFMARTYGRLTGQPGVVLSTLGPWATNLMTWVAYANLGWFPLIVITWQKPIKESKQWQFQIIDVVEMMKPVTKYATTVVSGHRLPYILQNAFTKATSERPGAVAIELPEDIAREYVDDHVDINFLEQKRPVVDSKYISRYIPELESAKSPIILIWAWANRKRVTKYLTRFIEKYNMPFFTSQMWKWVVSEDLPQYIGTWALSSNDYIHNAIHKSDLIIWVWYDPVEKPTYLVWEWWTKTIHINFFPADIDKVYNPYLEIIWDIGHTFWQLDETQIDSSNWDFSEIYSIRDEYFKAIRQKIDDEIKSDNTLMWPRQLVEDIRDTLDRDDILALDNGLYKLWFARNYRTYESNTLLLDNALASMWAGLPSGMEAKIVEPSKDVVVVTGDGWLVMNLWDLETAFRLELDIVVVILNNHSYGMIEWKQWGMDMQKWGLRYWNPDFVKLAESFGGKWYKVTNKTDFKWVLEWALKEKWLKIIDLDFGEYPLEIR